MSYQKYIVTVYANRTEWKNELAQLHRIDGPAIEYANGYKVWYLNNKRHRTDGPAVEYADGHKEWWLNGKQHRTDGPAIEYAVGCKAWFLNDKLLTEEEFKARQKASCTDKEVVIDGIKYKLVKS